MDENKKNSSENEKAPEQVVFLSPEFWQAAQQKQDRLGAIRASVASLSLCAVLFLFSDVAVCGLLAVFLFNMTMPLTLFAMARLFPGARGFAFGTLTFALFLGYLPAALSLPVPFAGEGWWYAAEAILSLILLVAGLLACRRGGDGP